MEWEIVGGLLKNVFFFLACCNKNYFCNLKGKKSNEVYIFKKKKEIKPALCIRIWGFQDQIWAAQVNKANTKMSWTNHPNQWVSNPALRATPSTVEILCRKLPKEDQNMDSSPSLAF